MLHAGSRARARLGRDRGSPWKLTCRPRLPTVRWRMRMGTSAAVVVPRGSPTRRACAAATLRPSSISRQASDSEMASCTCSGQRTAASGMKERPRVPLTCPQRGRGERGHGERAPASSRAHWGARTPTRAATRACDTMVTHSTGSELLVPRAAAMTTGKRVPGSWSSSCRRCTDTRSDLNAEACGGGGGRGPPGQARGGVAQTRAHAHARTHARTHPPEEGLVPLSSTTFKSVIVSSSSSWGWWSTTDTSSPGSSNVSARSGWLDSSALGPVAQWDGGAWLRGLSGCARQRAGGARWCPSS